MKRGGLDHYGGGIPLARKELSGEWQRSMPTGGHIRGAGRMPAPRRVRRPPYLLQAFGIRRLTEGLYPRTESKCNI